MADHYLIEDIYSVTDEWEWCDMRLAPFVPFSEVGIGEEDIAQLLFELRQMGYVFTVDRYPECIMDVVDLVEGREFQRIVRMEQCQRDREMGLYECRPFVPLKRAWWRRVIDFLSPALSK